MSVVKLVFLVIFNIMGTFISRKLHSGVEGKRKHNLWSVVIDLLMKSTSDLSFSGLAKHVNSYKLKKVSRREFEGYGRCVGSMEGSTLAFVRAAGRMFRKVASKFSGNIIFIHYPHAVNPNSGLLPND